MTVFTIDPGYDQELQELEEFTSKSEIHPLTVEFLESKVHFESLIVLVGKKQLFPISKFVSIAEIKGKNSINKIYGYEDKKFCILDPLDPNLQLIPEIFYSLSEKLLVIEVQSGSPNDDSGCIFLSTKTKMDLGFATCNSVSARILTFVI